MSHFVVVGVFLGSNEHGLFVVAKESSNGLSLFAGEGAG